MLRFLISKSLPNFSMYFLHFEIYIFINPSTVYYFYDLPLAIMVSTTRTCPIIHARCNGVEPSSSVAERSAPVIHSTQWIVSYNIQYLVYNVCIAHTVYNVCIAHTVYYVCITHIVYYICVSPHHTPRVYNVCISHHTPRVYNVCISPPHS